jgi:hypothetical protein
MIDEKLSGAVSLRAAAAPGLPLSLPSEVVDFVGVDVEDDLAAARILVLDDELRALSVLNLLSRKVGDKNRPTCHALLLSGSPNRSE